jgi:hypothetical protein
MVLWTSRCFKLISAVQNLDWPQTNRINNSRCQSIDSRNDDHGGAEGTNTSGQNGAGCEVAGKGLTFRPSNRSPKLRQNTRRRGSSSITSRRRGNGRARCTGFSSTKTPEALSMDTLRRGENLADYTAIRGQPEVTTRWGNTHLILDCSLRESYSRKTLRAVNFTR